LALITGIDAPHRGSRRRILHADHDEWRTTSADVVKALGLREGHVEPAEDLAARIDTLEPRLARERVLRLLSYRDRSAKDLRDRLDEDGYPAAVAASVVADLQRIGLADDSRFAHGTARVLAQVRGYGRQRILRELEAHGVDPGLALEAVAEALPADDEEASALRMARAFASRPNADVGRIAARLARKGFSPALALRAARSAAGERALDEGSDLPVLDD